ncbi:DUF1659 domain-containing protein [Bacillus andreraoultii]|uniref:DUF1659 domain-containing protein n=1 Tax=Bacillus andreraoultii TaxID=1499685 RepID=UPI000539BEE9|nr:DUF1659 domain-containing protein [Bacillus andreraoultii]
MAEANIIKTNFRILYEFGLDQKGETVFKTKSYNNVKTSSTDEQIYEAALAIASLSSLPFFNVERDDKKEIYG